MIPASVTSIGAGAFIGCVSLRELVIPASVTTIERFAFQGCAALRELVIQAGVTTIADSAFSGCVALKHVVIPAGVTTIGRYAFARCAALVCVEIQAGVTTIANSAFSGCVALKHVVIPASVTTIGVTAFIGCNQLDLVVTSLSREVLQAAGLRQGAVVLTPQQAAPLQRVTLCLPQHNPAAIGCAPLCSFFSPASAPNEYRDAFRGLLSNQYKDNIREFFGVVETVLLVALRISRLNADAPEVDERAAFHLPDELLRYVLGMLFYVENTLNDGSAPAQSSIAKLRALC